MALRSGVQLARREDAPPLAWPTPQDESPLYPPEQPFVVVPVFFACGMTQPAGGWFVLWVERAAPALGGWPIDSHMRAVL